MLEEDIYFDSTKTFVLTVLFFISVRSFNIKVNGKEESKRYMKKY